MLNTQNNLEGQIALTITQKNLEGQICWLFLFPSASGLKINFWDPHIVWSFSKWNKGHVCVNLFSSQVSAFVELLTGSTSFDAISLYLCCICFCMGCYQLATQWWSLEIGNLDLLVFLNKECQDVVLYNCANQTCAQGLVTTNAMCPCWLKTIPSY